MAIVANQIKKGPFTTTVGDALTNVNKALIQADATNPDSAQASLISLAGSKDASWMADKGNQASFAKSLRANQFIN